MSPGKENTDRNFFKLFHVMSSNIVPGFLIALKQNDFVLAYFSMPLKSTLTFFEGDYLTSATCFCIPDSILGVNGPLFFSQENSMSLFHNMQDHQIFETWWVLGFWHISALCEKLQLSYPRCHTVECVITENLLGASISASRFPYSMYVKQ